MAFDYNSPAKFFMLRAWRPPVSASAVGPDQIRPELVAHHVEVLPAAVSFLQNLSSGARSSSTMAMM